MLRTIVPVAVAQELKAVNSNGSSGAGGGPLSHGNTLADRTSYIGLGMTTKASDTNSSLCGNGNSGSASNQCCEQEEEGKEGKNNNNTDSPEICGETEKVRPAESSCPFSH
jgi:hypothetical protein